MKISKRYVKADKVPFSFNPNELNDPSSLDLRHVVNRNIAEDNAKKAAAAKEARKAALMEEYGPLLNGLSGSTDDQMHTLFEAWVPGSGNADTLAGELIRAMMKIMYRDYNDGDVFYSGYGLETCGYCADYIADHVHGTNEMFIDIASRGLEDEAYTREITQVAQYIIDEIKSNPDEYLPIKVTESNDMMTGDGSVWVEYSPKYDYSIDMNQAGNIAQHVEVGNISREEVDSWVEDTARYDIFQGEENSEAYVESWGYLEYNLTNMSKEAYEHAEDDLWKWAEIWSRDLDNEYGDPWEVEDTEEEYEDEEYDDEEE